MKKALLSLITISLILLSACSKKTEENSEVLVSIPPYLYFVKALTDGKIKAISLVPPGANPHIFEPTPKQIQKAKGTKLWICLDESFEKKVGKSLKELNKNLIILNLANSSKIPYIYEKHKCSDCKHHRGSDTKDLHIWLSPKLSKLQADLIAKSLIEAFPDRKETIQENLVLLQRQLSMANKHFAKQLLPYKGNSIIVSHPAFGYFCRDYHLKQISIELEGKDPLPKHLTSILALARKSTVRAVFTQVQYSNKGAQIIAEQLGLPIHEVDPYSADYLQNLEKIVQYIVEP